MGQAGPGGFAAELGMRLGGGGLGAPPTPDFAGAEMQEAGNDLSLAEAEAPPFLGGSFLRLGSVDVFHVAVLFG